MRAGLLATFLAAIAIRAWDELKYEQRMPKPEVFWHIAVVWGVLGLISELGADDLAALFGLGYLLMLMYRFYLSHKVIEDDKVSGQYQGH